jgi:DNA modification methylase
MTRAAQRSLFAQPGEGHPSRILGASPLYTTPLGAAYAGDAADLLHHLPPGVVDLVVTSPPYALEFQKEYGNVSKHDYVEWFLPYARGIKRVLKETGSFVLNIGGSYNPGFPTRSVYHFKLLIALCEEAGFYLAQECFWYNPAKLPAPAEWVNVRRIRIKDTVEYVWWLAPTPWPYADNRRVLVPYSIDMRRLLRKGYRPKVRPSGHNITSKFKENHGGSIPANLIDRGNNESNSDFIKACRERGRKIHPARFPAAIPEFFIKFLTKPQQLVLDVFAGSNTTGAAAESLDRHWMAFDLNEDYLRTSALRFGLEPAEL